MVDVEALAGRASRVAARSRVRMAARVALFVLPLACIPVLGGAEVAACGCLGFLVFAVAAVFRWRDRAGRDAATAGLALGAIPLLTAFALRGCGVNCSAFSSFGEAEIACFAAGAVAGIGATLFVARGSADRRRRWLTTLLVASLTSALGCVGLGTAGVVATLVALVASATVVWIPVSLRTG